MSKILHLDYNAEMKFDFFLEQLRKGKEKEWKWLMNQFRERVKPWLFKKDGNLPHGSIVSVDEFIEEIFTNSLYLFYEKFQQGEFKSLADLRGLMFRIAELKLKEGYYFQVLLLKFFFHQNLLNWQSP